METKKVMVDNCKIKLRDHPQRRKERVFIGCGAGFGGDRPLAALKLLQNVEKLDYLVLECLAERTLADRYQIMMAGGKGFDPRISEWMSLLLPVSVEKSVRIITNMGGVDPIGAQKAVLDVANNLSLSITVSVVTEFPLSESVEEHETMKHGASTYLGAAPIVQCLEDHEAHVIVTSRVADAALFLGPMVYELGWNWNDFEQLAQGSLAGHLLECGCQLTGGYFMHPGDDHRSFSFEQLLDLSLPYAEVSFDGQVFVAKADGSGGALNHSTCTQQLLYEVGDPSAYITPDVVIDFQDVHFCPLSNDKICCIGAKPSKVPVPDKLLKLVPKYCGWKGWGEISYGGYGCVKRAEAANLLVRSWMNESFPGVGEQIASCIIGLDSLKITSNNKDTSSLHSVMEIRLRMDGLFKEEEHAIKFTLEFMALYTNGPAGGGGISIGHKKEIILSKELVERELVHWQTSAKQACSGNSSPRNEPYTNSLCVPSTASGPECRDIPEFYGDSSKTYSQNPAPSGKLIRLYEVAHARTGDKGNDLNFSIIPHYPPDIERIKTVITSEWVKAAVSPLLDTSSFPDPTAVKKRQRWVDDQVAVNIYEVRGVHSLNIVVRNILDGGVNCSRRVDRHGKTISDLILCKEIILP